MNQHASPTSGGSSGNNWLRIVYALVGIMILGFVLGSLHSCQQEAANRQTSRPATAIRGVNNRDQVGSTAQTDAPADTRTACPALRPGETQTCTFGPEGTQPIAALLPAGTLVCINGHPFVNGTSMAVITDDGREVPMDGHTGISMFRFSTTQARVTVGYYASQSGGAC